MLGTAYIGAVDIWFHFVYVAVGTPQGHDLEIVLIGQVVPTQAGSRDDRPGIGMAKDTAVFLGAGWVGGCTAYTRVAVSVCGC
jgi:hypothetical protein